MLLEKLNNVENEIDGKLNSLTNEMAEIDFTLEHLEDDDKKLSIKEKVQILISDESHLALPQVQLRNDMTGDVFDVHVTNVSKEGIRGINFNDWSEITPFYHFEAMFSYREKIELMEEIESRLK